jgi:triphosphatase
VPSCRPAIESIGDLPGVTALDAAVAERRAASYADAAEAIGSARYTALVLRLMRWSEQRNGADRSSGPLSQPIAEIAPRIVKRRLKRVRRRGAGFARQSAKKRHRLRIALKKLRYTAEMLAPLCDPDKSDSLLRAVKKLQEKLGDANDVRMSRDLLAELARTGTDAAAVARAGGAVLDWHRRRLKRAEGKTEKQLAKFRKKVSSW